MPHEQKPEGKSLRSQSLDLLRFPLAVIVAAIHVTATRSYWVDGSQIRFSDMDGSHLFYGFFDAFLRNQSVPIYFFIAGYVFFLGITLTIDTYGHKLKNRTKSLLIPYVSWNTLAVLIALLAFLPEFKTILPNIQNIHFHWNIPSILETFWNAWFGIFSTDRPMAPGGLIYPQDYPLWFVRDLMIIVVSAPMIYFCLKTTRWYAVAFIGIVWFALSPYKLGHFSQMLNGYFFFTWGAYMSYHGRDMIKDFRHFFKLCAGGYLVISTALWLCNFPEWLYDYLKSANVILGMVMAYGLASLLIESGRVKTSKFLAASSFFVYAGHGLIVAYINVALFQIFTPRSFLPVALIYLTTLIIAVGGLCVLFGLLGKYAPLLQQIFAGRRYKK
ncbi:MAG: acyltransferase [Bacteroidales bacterium]|nr:acyltransferase [Bacteroidales bacterium]